MDVDEFSYSVSLSSPLISNCSFILVLVLLFGFTPVEGESQVIGSLQPIVAAPGDDVVLPCHVEPPLDVAAMTVVWLRPDLKPDPKDRLSRVEYVHFYRNKRDFPDMKISSFRNRTMLFKDGLTRGNISLKITNVTLSDEGRFQCFIPTLDKSSIVLLVVETNSAKTWTTEPPLQPISNQTPGLKGETDANGGLSGRSRWSVVVVVVVFCFFVMILGVGVTRYSSRKC